MLIPLLDDCNGSDRYKNTWVKITAAIVRGPLAGRVLAARHSIAHRAPVEEDDSMP